MTQTNPLVSIRRLSVGYLQEDNSVARIIHDIHLDLFQGRCLALVGESGCGKSTLAKTINRTLKAPAVIEDGEIDFEGESLVSATLADMNRHRWSDISMIVQSALDALNPVKRIEDQILDVMRAHGKTDVAANQKRLLELFEMVELPARHLKSFPHELSGGMRQRAIIAMSLALSPKLLIMDEPTTALDVVTQMDILSRIKYLQQSLKLSILFITHDLPLTLDYADEIAVMYAGEIVEHAPAEQLRTAAAHPYTQGLLNSFPVPSAQRQPLQGIGGRAINFSQKESACSFFPRCSKAQPVCRTGPIPHCKSGNHRLQCVLGFVSDVSKSSGPDEDQTNSSKSIHVSEVTSEHQSFREAPV